MKHTKSEEDFLPWDELTPDVCSEIRVLAAKQLLRRYLANLTRTRDPCLWGNEIESIILKKHNKGVYTLSTHHDYSQIAGFSNQLTLMPEFAQFILEFIPNTPFGEDLRGVYFRCDAYITRVFSLFDVAELKGFTVLLATCYPLFGQDFLSDRTTIDSHAPGYLDRLKAKMLDYVTNTGRYRTLTSNMLLRKGNIPWITVPSSSGNTYYLPGPLFGMGLCGMHVTVQSATMEDSRLLYDALQPLCPLLLALSASTSVMAGIVLGRDVRISYLSEAMDDHLATGCSVKQPKRYGIAGTYIASHPANIPLLNDLLSCSPEGNDAASILQPIDSDSRLCAYAHSVLSHFPLVVFRDALASDDADVDLDCWDQVSSLVWPSCRWKVPPLGALKKDLGWRTEVRCMEMQFSVAENVAYAVFVFLLSNAIRDMGLLFYIPQSFILQDMFSAEQRNAVVNGLFWARDLFLDLHFEELSDANPQANSLSPFSIRCRRLAIETFSSQISLALENRRRFATLESSSKELTDTDTWCPNDPCTCVRNSISDFHLIKLTVKEFMCGSARYPGLIPVLNMYVDAYFDQMGDAASEDIAYIRSVLSFLTDRATGALPTCATAVRNLIQGIYAHRNNSPIGEHSDTLSEAEIQAIVEYMLGARHLSLDSLRKYYTAHTISTNIPG